MMIIQIVIPGLWLAIALTHMLNTCKKTARNHAICVQMNIALPLFAKRVKETVAWTQNVKDPWFVDT